MKLIILILLSSSLSWAQPTANVGGAMLLSLNAGIFSQESTEGTTETKLTVTNADANLGYMFASGIYLGAFYGSKNQESGTTKPSASHYGGTLGLYSGGWFLNAHYLTGGKLLKTAADTNWEEGTGGQADLGYQMRVGGPFFIGLQITYRSMTYEKKLVNEVEVIGDPIKIDEIFPAMRLTFIF